MTRRAVLGLVALVALLAVGNAVAYRHNAEVDLSASHRFSLAPETKAVLRQVHAPLHVIAFVNSTGSTARDARFLLSRYQEVNHRISFSVLDPDTNPGAAVRYGITKYETVVLTYRGRRVDAPSVDELDVSTGILRIVRGGTQTVCVLTGHGEPSLDDTSTTGLSGVGQILQHNAYDVRRLDLTVGQAAVPPECVAVLVIGPQDTLNPQEVAALDAYARGAGRLMVVASSLTRADPNPLVNPWGIHFLGGVVLDPQRSEGSDESNVIVQDLPSANPVDGGVSRLQFPAPAGLSAEAKLRDGLTVSALAVTSPASWDEATPDVATQFHPGDIPGPIVVAAAADDSRVEATGDRRVPGNGPTIVRTRVFVTGSDTWLTNGYLDRLGNRRFFVNALAWLTQQEQLLAQTSQVSTERPLPLTAELQTRVLVLTVGLVPGLIIGAGLLTHVAWRRRRRRT